MSTHSFTTRYRCSQDCCQSGCPGHDAEIIWRSTALQVEWIRDGQSRLLMDVEEFRALVDSAMEVPL